MSTHDVISLMLQFGLFLNATLTLVMTMYIELSDKKNKKK